MATPQDAIGYIGPNLPPNVQQFLEVARKVVINGQTAAVLKKMLASAKDVKQTIAAFVGKTIESLQNKLGPLDDQSYKLVATYIVGWIVATLAKMGMPGLDSNAGKRDLTVQITQLLVQMQQGQGQGAAPATPGAPPQAAPVGQGAGVAAPLAQFGGQ